MAIQNCSVQWFARQLRTWGEYFVNQNHFLVRKHGVHKKIAYFLYNEYICSVILMWLKIQKPPQQTGHILRQFLITNLLSGQEIISVNTEISWLNNIYFNVADTDNKKG